MRIAYIAAGAAGMYCGTCIHDNTLAAALQEAGHEVALLPLYTPLRTDEEDVSRGQIFYGALNVYLQQKSGLFRHTPRLLDRWLDRPALLSAVSKLAASTDARDLGDLTLSVLRAEHGRQRKELERLVDWLEGFDPDIVQLANSMLLGIGGEIKRRLDVPLVCALTGEDIFLEQLPEPRRSEVIEEMQRRAARTDAFVSTSDYYAGAMRELLGIPAERMHVVHLGVNLEFIGTTHRTRDAGDDIVVGYMARICPEKGLHLLLEALHRIFVERPELPIRGRVAGYVGKRDADYLAALERRLDERGIADRVTVLGEVDLEGKRQLLQRADILSVPTVYREPKGLFVLEALAHGVPVVQPEHGAFPELVESTGGGLLVEPGSPEALAEGIVRLAEDDELRGRLGESGRRAVRERFDSHTMAERTAEIYRRAQEDAA